MTTEGHIGLLENVNCHVYSLSRGQVANISKIRYSPVMSHHQSCHIMIACLHAPQLLEKEVAPSALFIHFAITCLVE